MNNEHEQQKQHSLLEIRHAYKQEAHHIAKKSSHNRDKCSAGNEYGNKHRIRETEDSHTNTAKGAEDKGFRGLTHKKVRKSVDRATAYTAYAVGDTIAEKSTAYALAQGL